MGSSSVGDQTGEENLRSRKSEGKKISILTFQMTSSYDVIGTLTNMNIASLA
jgi:hypothetical protein